LDISSVFGFLDWIFRILGSGEERIGEERRKRGAQFPLLILVA
jgi:hypothetical protein